MKKFLFIFIFPCIISLAYSQTTIEYAPLNPKYVEFMEAQAYKAGNLPGDYGLLPMPIMINHKNHSIDDRKKSNFPIRYDLREEGFVTSVKDQGNGNFGGNCWSFSTMGAIESNWLVNGYGSYDLSEQNISKCHGFEWGYGEGGNRALSLAYITRLDGPVAEQDDVYDTNDSLGCKEGLVPVAYVTDAIYVNHQQDVLKQALMDHGGIYVSMRWERDPYFSESDNTYYYGGIENENHAVLLVGWDDEKKTAGGVGAWICKNQWKTEFADSGYFYISYNDTRIAEEALYFPKRLEVSEIDTLYMYDELGPLSSIGFKDNTAYGLVKFEADGKQFIHRIGTFINTDLSVIDIEIYDDFDGQLSNKIAGVKNIGVEFAGFHTFDVPAVVEDDFYVKVRYFTPGSKTPIPVETTFQQSASFVKPVIEEKGKQWVSSSGTFWNAADKSKEEYAFDLSIRAYVSKKSPVAFFSSDKKKVCKDGGKVTFTNYSFGNLDSLKWDFGQDAIPASATDTVVPDTLPISHQVSYSSSGYKTISCVAFSGGIADTLIRKNYVEVGEQIDVITGYNEIEVRIAESFTIDASGADSYTWFIGPDTISRENSFSRIEVFEGQYKLHVKGQQGSCQDYDSVNIKIVKRPLNDQVCQAIDLDYGENGPFNNANGTVQDNEPTPPEDGCLSPMSWCKEGGLHNSVWFKFKALETSKMSLETSGIDVQVAVYDADSCEGILNNNFTMLAANDDIGLNTKDARIQEIPGLVPGKYYWIQVDGSHGGDTGQFYINLSQFPYNLEEFPDDNYLSVYPNPSTGILNVMLKEQARNVKVNLFDTKGIKVLTQVYPGFHDSFNETLYLTGLKAGMYFLQVLTDNNSYKKLILVMNKK